MSKKLRKELKRLKARVDKLEADKKQLEEKEKDYALSIKVVVAATTILELITALVVLIEKLSS